jgi:hypothetical protein
MRFLAQSFTLRGVQASIVTFIASPCSEVVSQSSRRDIECRVESSDEPKIGRYGFDLCIGQAGIHNSQKIFDFTRTSRLALVSAGNSSVAGLGRSQEPPQTEATAKNQP